MAGVELGAHENEEIRVGWEAAESFTEMARHLCRAASTVSQAVGRNGGRPRYRTVHAARRAVAESRRPKRTKFQRNRPLTDHVETRLVALNSPTAIAIELARAGGVSGDTVSAETIYQGVYGHGTRGLAKNRARSQTPPQEEPPQASLSSGRGTQSARAVEGVLPDRAAADLGRGPRGAGPLGGRLHRQCEERLCGLDACRTHQPVQSARRSPRGHDAESVLACLVELFERVPTSMRRTLTWDQGRKMARHNELAGAVDLDVYFAGPHSPWLRGANENFNGLVRRYVGKGTNLSANSQ